MKKAFTSMFKVKNAVNTADDAKQYSGSKPSEELNDSDDYPNNTMKSSITSNVDSKSDFFKHQLSPSSSPSFITMKNERKNSADHSFESSSRRKISKDISDGLTVVCSSPPSSDNEETALVECGSGGIQKSAKSFEHHMKTEASKRKMLSEGFKAESATATNQELRRLQSNDSTIEERSSMSGHKSKLEANGFKASKMAAIRQEQKHMQIGDTLVSQQSSAKASAMNFCSEESMSQKKMFESQKEERKISHGMVQEEKNHTSHSSSRFISNKTANGLQFLNTNAIESGSPQPIIEEPFSPTILSLANEVDMEFDLLSLAAATTSALNNKTFSNNSNNYKSEASNMKGSMDKLEHKMSNLVDKLNTGYESLELLNVMTEMLRKAWSVPQCGYDLGFNMSKIIRTGGALEVLIKNMSPDSEWQVQWASAQLLEQCLTADNRAYVANNGLSDVVNVANQCIELNSVDETRVGTGLLSHLFKHSEDVCQEVIALGGLQRILFECRSNDLVTLRNCASALANLSLYGGPDNQVSMIQSKAPVWLFPLAFHNDDNIKYYACLAIAVLVANKEVEAAVLQSGTLDLVEPFISSHNPQDFAKSSTTHIHGQSKNWLLRLVPVLNSKREEARSLAAFHFAMEAWIKKTQDNTSIFCEIGAIEPLKKVAASPNALASKYAAQALALIGEEIPHKLTQQVPLWSIEDVKEWVKQIGFSQFAQEFVNSRVDGDLLLQLNEEMLREDIGIKNGILRKRFLRELASLKRISDYSSCDTTNLNNVLNSLGPEYSKYTYSMLQCGVDQNTLRMLDEEVLREECRVDNSIHRLKIMQAIRGINDSLPRVEDKDEDKNKNLDVFVSYRRSNGSQLASLLKVHLQLRGFSVFIDVERLEAGKFDNNLLDSIKQAKNFVLVLSPNALDRCLNDVECKDWIHREVVEALKNNCNIVPILDSFQWPESEDLPEDMRAICHFNGIRWIHDYQEACVDKLERFIKGDFFNKLEMGGALVSRLYGGVASPSTPSMKPILYQRSGSNDSGKSSEHH